MKIIKKSNNKHSKLLVIIIPRRKLSSGMLKQNHLLISLIYKNILTMNSKSQNNAAYKEFFYN